MANKTSNIDQLTQSQGSKEVTVNSFSNSASQAATYGRHASNSSGLQWGYYGGVIVRSDGDYTTVANGSVTLTASATNYLVASKDTGNLTLSTTAGDWNNTSDFYRLYQVETNSTEATDWTDSRVSSFNGAAGGGGGGSSGSAAIIADVPEQRLGQTLQFQIKATPADDTWHRVLWSRLFGRYWVIPNTAATDGMISLDGHTWALQQLSPTTATWTDIIEARELGKLFNCNDDGIFVGDSTDGLTWTYTNTGLTGTMEPQALVWAADISTLIILGRNSSFRGGYSTDGGVTWTHSDLQPKSWYSGAWSPKLGLFVAMGDAGELATSSDGIAWTTPVKAVGGNTNNWRSVEWSPELEIFVAVSQGNGPGERIIWSSDGLNWIQTQPPTQFDTFRGLVWCPEIGLWYAVGPSTNTDPIVNSKDGVNWTAGPVGSANAHRSVTWSTERGEVCLVSESGTLNRAEVLLGKAGSWTPVVTPIANINAITIFDGQWLRNMDVVTLSVRIDIEAASSTTLTQADVTPPHTTTTTPGSSLAGSYIAFLKPVVGSVDGVGGQMRITYSSPTGAQIFELGRINLTYRIT